MITDNSAVHRSTDVGKRVAALNIHAAFLPLYSPDLNTIIHPEEPKEDRSSNEDHEPMISLSEGHLFILRSWFGDHGNKVRSIRSQILKLIGCTPTAKKTVEEFEEKNNVKLPRILSEFLEYAADNPLFFKRPIDLHKRKMFPSLYGELQEMYCYHDDAETVFYLLRHDPRFVMYVISR